MVLPVPGLDFVEPALGRQTWERTLRILPEVHKLPPMPKLGFKVHPTPRAKLGSHGPQERRGQSPNFRECCANVTHLGILYLTLFVTVPEFDRQLALEQVCGNGVGRVVHHIARRTRWNKSLGRPTINEN
jgi:hypothetical protein